MRRSTFAVVSAIIFGIVGHTFHSWLNTYDLDSRIYLGIWLGAGTIVGSVLESILARFNTKLLPIERPTEGILKKRNDMSPSWSITE